MDAMNQFLRANTRYDPLIHSEPINQVRQHIVDLYAKEQKHWSENSTFRHVVKYLDEKDATEEMIPVSALFDWFISEEIAKELKQKSISALRFAQVLSEKKNLKDTMETLLERKLDGKEETSEEKMKGFCCVCEKATDYRCKDCHLEFYCDLKCQEKHEPLHNKFCTGRTVFEDIPRLCECCGKETSMGCKICSFPFCSANCYIKDEKKHSKHCRPYELGGLVETLLKRNAKSVPLLKNGVTQLLYLPIALCPATCKNVFNPFTDTRAQIRENFAPPHPHEHLVQSACFVKDYLFVSRLVHHQLVQGIAKEKAKSNC
jgi:hypothetical protein